MYELYPYFTNDGSVGLFSCQADDIYHSTYGALSEAYEKFILPAEFENYFKNNNEIKILDLCFGIGYNTKSFLNYFFEKISKSKNNYNATIHTDNNFASNLYNKNSNIGVCNGAVYTDNFTENNLLISKGNCFSKCKENCERTKIFITAIDTDKNLVYLSPFFKTDKKVINNNGINFEQAKISKMLKKKSPRKYKLKEEINIILLNKLIDSNNSIFEDEEFNKILKEKKYSRYFDKSMLRLYNFYRNERLNTTSKSNKTAFLHNIYYRYISSSHKRTVNNLRIADIKLDLKILDARKALIDDVNTYDFIFLDAFTPTKCPSLWTVEFFQNLYHHLSDNGMILTYSNSANVRNAFVKTGFYIGKIYDKEFNKFTGTIATKNKNLIKNKLTELDLGLLKTKAGIVYHDENLSLTNEEIIEKHKIEFENSSLISSSKYMRKYKEAK